MTHRVSAWKLKERLGKMRSEAFARWIEMGVIGPPGQDDRWDDSVLERLGAAITLEPETKTLSRRAFRLTQLGYPLPPEARRAASLDVLRRVRPPSGKMAQVRRELDAVGRRTMGRPPAKPGQSFRLSVDQAQWARAIERAPASVFDPTFEVATRWAAMIPSVTQAVGLKGSRAIPIEERAVLLLVELLLQERAVRNRLGLGLGLGTQGPPSLS